MHAVLGELSPGGITAHPDSESAELADVGEALLRGCRLCQQHGRVEVLSQNGVQDLPARVRSALEQAWHEVGREVDSLLAQDLFV